jgi:acyl-CoA synthetase (AMP-forming)/AMP-acid ligase II
VVLSRHERRWNYADVWEALASRFGDSPALLHGPVIRTWGDFDSRADGLAASLLDFGLRRQDKVAQYCRNRPEYLESMFAAFKAGLVPVNTNFRYGDEELSYLWKDSDTTAVVFDAEFTETCDRLRHQLPEIKAWLRVPAPALEGAPDSECPDWAVPYEVAASAARGEGPTQAPWGRSGDDLNLLYTGGTTGMPKGVMWPQHDFFLMIEHQYGRTPPEEADLEGYLARYEKPGPRVLPGPPLMHGTACWFSMAALSAAGSVVTLTRRHFDPVELLDTIVERAVKGVCIVGDPFAKPILAELDANPGRWDLSGVRLIMSSGAMLSRETKERLITHAPRARLVDGLGSSESGSLGTAVAEKPEDAATARFRLGDNVRVLDDDGRDVVPGSGRQGRLAVGGHLPLGYYKDPVKTASTFLTIDGRRYVVAGDWAIVESDGTITLLGRGSGCINTAGEKVYPEEVEEVLKGFAGVHDACVVGMPDDRFGEAVVALVQMEPGADFDEAALVAHAKAHLAGYKAPRRILAVKHVARHANGKMDYAAMKDEARSRLSSS